MTMKKSSEVNSPKTVVAILDLSYQSGREQLAGIYRFQQMHGGWDIRLISSNDPRFQPAIVQSLSDEVDGVIVKIGSALDMTPILQAERLPLVCIERPPKDQIADFRANGRPFAIIGIDNDKVGVLAAEYLSSLGNFANYIFIHDPNDNEWSRLRGSALRRTLQKQKLDAQVLTLSEFEDKLPRLQTPIAIFAAFDLLATNVLKACRKANLSVAGDAVVLSVDNDSFTCENTNPTLSSIRLDHENVGFFAAKALDALMAGKRVRTNEEMPPLDVIVRNSTIYIPPSRLLVDRAMRIIESRGTKGLRATDVAKHLGVSPSLLNLRFQQARNCSLRDTLIAARLGEVMRLLKTSNYPVSQIAKMSGFSSSTVLNHLFKRKLGISPDRWRKAQRTPPNH